MERSLIPTSALSQAEENQNTELLVEEFSIVELEDRLGMELPINRNCFGCPVKGT